MLEEANGLDQVKEPSRRRGFRFYSQQKMVNSSSMLCYAWMTTRPPALPCTRKDAKTHERRVFLIKSSLQSSTTYIETPFSFFVCVFVQVRWRQSCSFFISIGNHAIAWKRETVNFRKSKQGKIKKKLADPVQLDGPALMHLFNPLCGTASRFY